MPSEPLSVGAASLLAAPTALFRRGTPGGLFVVMSMGMAVMMLVLAMLVVMMVVIMVMTGVMVMTGIAMIVPGLGMRMGFAVRMGFGVGMRGAGIGAAFGIERRLDLDHPRA